MQSRPEIYVIDDEESVRRSLAFMLTSADYEVQTFASAREFLAAEPTLPPGCVITDVRMPDVDGIELVRHLQSSVHRRCVIVITGAADVRLAVDAMRAGAHDFIEKPFEDQVLLTALGNVIAEAQSQTPLEPRGDLLDGPVSAPRLSRREQEVLTRVVSGKTNKVIARELEISPRTVEVYRAGVMRKFRADSLSGLVRQAIQAGF